MRAVVPATASAIVDGWGWNEAGQLGDGTTANSPLPVMVGSVSGITAMTGAGAHGLVIAGGNVYAWGWNHYGELGDGTYTGPQLCVVGKAESACSTSPIKVGTLGGIVSIAAGDEHSLALSSTGTVWAWGTNQYGELGNGTMTTTGCICIDHPVKAKVPAGITALAGGGRYTLALRNDGTVWSWGYNANGELGNGTTANSARPAQIPNLSGVIAISAGYFHGMALTSGGAVYTWGMNNAGQLGNGTTTSSTVPVRVTGLSGVTAISGGGTFSMALRSDGTVWTWGHNGYGELGNGSTVTESLVPVQVATISGITRINAGHKNGYAIGASGNVWAWGEDDYGELGNGTTGSISSVPVQVKNITGITSLGSGDRFALALKP